MKKLFCILSLICLMSPAAFADTDFTQVINSSKMPTDAEIMQILSRFNLNDEQKKVIFNGTKKKLQDMYSSKYAVDNANADLNLYLKVMECEGLSEFVGSSVTKDVKAGIQSLPKTNTSDYSSVDLSKVKYDKEADAAAQRKFKSIGVK